MFQSNIFTIQFNLVSLLLSSVCECYSVIYMCDWIYTDLRTVVMSLINSVIVHENTDLRSVSWTTWCLSVIVTVLCRYLLWNNCPWISSRHKRISPVICVRVIYKCKWLQILLSLRHMTQTTNLTLFQWSLLSEEGGCVSDDHSLYMVRIEISSLLTLLPGFTDKA